MTINQFINNFTISKAVKHSKPEHYNGKKRENLRFIVQQVVMLICLSCHLHLLLPAAATVPRIHILLVIPPSHPTLRTPDPLF